VQVECGVNPVHKREEAFVGLSGRAENCRTNSCCRHKFDNQLRGTVSARESEVDAYQGPWQEGKAEGIFRMLARVTEGEVSAESSVSVVEVASDAGVDIGRVRLFARIVASRPVTFMT